MRHGWRWFGPSDPTTLAHIRQAGATDVVTALYHHPPGQVWPEAEVAALADGIRAAGLVWSVAESLPVSEEIKRGAPAAAAHIDAWCAGLRALAAAGVETVCYNFMPVLDWTRTELARARPSGARTMAFDLPTLAAFDIHLLERPGADDDYPAEVVDRAGGIARAMDDAAREALTRTIIKGLPGAVLGYDARAFRAALEAYSEVGEDGLRRNLAAFLQAVVPEAEALGLRLCIHPDDPPVPLFGLPRIVSTEADLARVLSVIDSPANGLTLCAGSLGARADNDLPAMMRRFGDRVHFLHLRATKRTEEWGPYASFFEDEHLAGDLDMVALIDAVLAEEARREGEGRPDARIPMRPDHGQAILSDLDRDGLPGYPSVGRLRGLAELRGVERALNWRAGGDD